MARLLLVLPALLAMSASPAPHATAAVADVQKVAVAVPPNAPPQRAKVGADIGQAADGLFYVEGLVNGTPVRFVVDTGASIVVLTKSDAARSGLAVDDANSMSVQTAAGTTRMRNVRLDRVVVAGREIVGVDAAVIGDTQGVSLLGQSALARLDSVTMKERRLRLN